MASYTSIQSNIDGDLVDITSKSILAAALAIQLLPAFGAQAQVSVEDAKRGRQLAEKLCVNCHVIAPDHANVAGEAAQAFSAMAALPGQTRERLAGKIVVPHPDMPAVPLTRSEIRDLVAYIISLKESQ